ncbi:50S ribosomal protein chloroplastic-like [Trifolium pratense]|uniref:Large ribosomal subunit protein uL4c n=1 Tax=Trifolium pratense TaxID=57577 RepID=A0A2K3PCW0_TRIPR|nr:50S ribosomal protein chloroplastic-like [Trifolium pratense]
MASLSTLTPTSTSLSFFSSSIFSNLNSTKSKFKFPSNSHSHSLSVSCKLATLPLLSFSGEKIGESTLDIKSAPPSTSRAVVHRAIVHDLQNKRRGTASTLTRGEVRGGGRKPYGQKKTGRARQGSIRTPLRPGGGVIFGPKPRDWSIKINKKEKRLAISTAIASAAVNTVVVEEFDDEFEGKAKTKEFIAAMKRWGVDPKEKATFFMLEVTEEVELASRNLGRLKILTPRTLNLYDILNADKIVLTPSAVDYLNGRYGENYQDDDDDEEEDEDDEEDEEEDDNVEEEVEDGEEGK